MTTRARRTLTVALVLLAGPVGLADPPAAHGVERVCGNAAMPDGLHVEIRVRGTTCAAARRILAWYSRSTSPCGGSSCYRTHDGWGCGSASPASRPRLFSCGRDDRVAVAYEMRGRVTL